MDQSARWTTRPHDTHVPRASLRITEPESPDMLRGAGVRVCAHRIAGLRDSTARAMRRDRRVHATACPAQCARAELSTPPRWLLALGQMGGRVRGTLGGSPLVPGSRVQSSFSSWSTPRRSARACTCRARTGPGWPRSSRRAARPRRARAGGAARQVL